MNNISTFTSPAPDVDDEGFVRAMTHLGTELSPLGSVALQVDRFGHVAYDGPAERAAVIKALFEGLPADPPPQTMRTVSQIALRVGGQCDLCAITVDRIGTPTTSLSLRIEPDGFRYLLSKISSAEQEASQKATQLGQAAHSDRNSQNRLREEHASASGRLAAARKELQDAAPELLRRMYTCVASCYKVGLLGSTNHASNSASGETSALSAEIAALRQTIHAQQRNAGDHAKNLADEYDRRSKTLLDEAASREQRLQAEFKDRELRSAAEISAREAAVIRQAEELEARETKLNLNDDKAERRRLRGEIHAAAKQLAEKPDLSKDAQEAFARVVKASFRTAISSSLLLLVAVFGPFILSFWLTTQASELTYLGWSLRALAGLMLGASLVYYIQALSGRARLIAETEVRSRQFALDIDRANWLVEMSFEYEKIQKPLSPDLIAAFSRGLFEARTDAAPDARTQLTNLLVNADGLEVSLSRRGVRKALRAAPPNDESTTDR